MSETSRESVFISYAHKDGMDFYKTIGFCA